MSVKKSLGGTGSNPDPPGDGDPVRRKLLSGHLLARNTLYNLLGKILPLLVGLVVIPQLISALGTERFGILTIIWMAIGYFSLFDFGLGRTLTKFVADRLGEGREGEIPALVGTAFAVMVALGVGAAFLIGAFAPWGVYHVLNVPDVLEGETLAAMRLLAATIPFVIMTTALVGILQAYQYFGWVSVVRAPLGVFNFIGPLLALKVVDSLVAVTIVLAVGRIVAWLIYGGLVSQTLPGSWWDLQFESSLLRELLSFGGWLTVSNVIGPLMVYLDRFLIGAMLTMSAVAYYTTPYDMVTKLWMLPAALMGVMFPAMTTALKSDSQRAALLFERAGFVLMVATFPILLGIALFAKEGLTLWLGSEFAAHSAPILRLLALGVFVNSLSRIPFALLQGCGRADLTAKIHLVELPVYLLMLWGAVVEWGIIGAAVAWVLRVGMDTFALFVLGEHTLPEVSSATRKILLHTSVLCIVFLSAFLWMSMLWKLAVYGATIVIFGILAWKHVEPVLKPLIKKFNYAAF